MARYKVYNPDQSKMLPITFADQILPGTFEYTVAYLIDEEFDLSDFDARYDNDKAGRPAYDPAIMLKIVLVAYSRGITSSRGIERLCRENVIFMALSCDTQPHFTTIAQFISQMHQEIQELFIQLLMVCNSQGLIGREMFAIDGCKMPSNASKDWSGTHAQMTKKHKKIDRAVRRMLAKHREEDESAQENDHTRRHREEKQIDTLREASRKIKKFSGANADRRGIGGRIVQSNITDNDSAKMKTSHGVIQGYNGVAAVDGKHQIVIAAQAFGQGPENNLLPKMTDLVKTNLGQETVKQSKVSADSGFHSKATLEYCRLEKLDVYLADGGFRKRDPRFAEYTQHKPKRSPRRYFRADEFHYDAQSQSCVCPAGKAMWRSGRRAFGGNEYIGFDGYLGECRDCPLQGQCMRKPPTTRGRQVSIKVGQARREEPDILEQMRNKIDSPRGRHEYSRRLGIVEPVFGNINTAKRLNRFSLRGKSKVNAQWLMYCMVHNIEKIQRVGLIP